jgi:hypothetical protein
MRLIQNKTYEQPKSATSNAIRYTTPQLSVVDCLSDTLLQSIELAVAAEELGAEGAYFRVHHFARQLASQRCHDP